MNKNPNIIEKITNSKNPYFIAEIGINHNGSISLAKEMIDAAKENGADCVKFQSFIVNDYISSLADKASYQKQDGLENKSQRDIIGESQLSIDQIIEVREYAFKKNIDFLSTPFEIKSLKSLIDIKIDGLKISSCNLTNYPFLEEAAESKLPILLSTGMADYIEVKKAVSIFKKNNSPLLIFQCTSNYPSKISNANLNVIKTYQKKFSIPVGLSDHTPNNITSIVAVALGAVAIEKHFTISRDLPGIDQKASIEPTELKILIKEIRESKKSLGSYDKFRTGEENDTFKVLRRSLVASRNLQKGEKITKEMISIMRPGNGLTTNYMNKILGKRLNKNINKHELFKLKDIS